MSKGWNDLMLKKLKALMGKGLSTAEMGKKLGMSKNAVVGKLNRLGWNAKANDVEKKSAKKSTKTAKAPVKATKTAKTTKTTTKKTTKVASKPTKSVAKTKTTSTKSAVKTSVKKEKAPAKKSKTTTTTKNAVAKTPAKKSVVAEKKESKKAVKPVMEMPVIKTASKKTKKDLASHELYIEHAKKMAELKPNQCRWPIGDPDSNNFRFCGEPVFPGKPYCYEHCRQAYQFAPVKKK